MPASKPRTKTFTGCWTCRKRHVKCDEQRPDCLRCRRSGRLCQGYGVRLGWTNTEANMAQQRRQLRSTIRAYPELSSDIVTAFLADLDHYSSSTGSLQRGPFSVFAISPSRELAHNELSEGSSGNLELQSDSCGEESKSSQESVSNKETLSTVPESSPSTASPFFEVVPSPPADSSLPRVEVLDRSPMNTLNLGRPEWKSPFLSIPRMPNPTPIPVPEIELIHHWVVFLSGNMLLIDTADNPCRTVFMPLALEGLNASPKFANMHRAVFHAICAASAFSLFHLGGESRFQSLAVGHDQQALRHLRETLHPGRRLDETILTAVLSCITAEAMSGRRGRWRTHVAGGLGLLEDAVKGGWTQNNTTTRLLQSYLSLSSLCNLRMSRQLSSLLSAPSDCRYYLERSHGVTSSLVHFLAHISELRDSIEDVTANDLDLLELQLYLKFPSAPVSETTESKVIQHALNSFYYSTVIYFRRTMRRAPLSEVQDLVEKAVQDLEAVEALTHQSGGCAYNWASFIVAAECERPDLQARTLSLFNVKRRHGITNIQVLFDLVQILWQREAPVHHQGRATHNGIGDFFDSSWTADRGILEHRVHGTGFDALSDERGVHPSGLHQRSRSLLLHHLADHGALRKPDTGLIDVDDLLPLGQTVFMSESRCSTDTSSVHSNIYATKLLSSFLDRSVNGFFFRYINLDNLDNNRGELLEQLSARRFQLSDLDVKKSEGGDAILGQYEGCSLANS
ncbi:fungal-specific transcription factor domain-containing protein [Aspergillus ambiguus]|uniref:Zn(II)2Cys6 transcription factor n=1 Tax=Aspergillus ambiguus TaxID=176160 RepID=UPI003CCCBDCB